MNEDFPTNPEAEELKKQNRRKRVADFIGGASLGIASLFLFEHSTSLESLSYERTFYSLLTVASALGSAALIASSIFELRRDDGDDNGGPGDEPEPVMPPDEPGGIQRDVTDLTVADILDTPQLIEIREKVH